MLLIPPLLLWYFFGTICMANAPGDCLHVTFDAPYVENAPVFPSAGKCAAALSRKWSRFQPPRVMGAEWKEFGCEVKSR